MAISGISKTVDWIGLLKPQVALGQRHVLRYWLVPLSRSLLHLLFRRCNIYIHTYVCVCVYKQESRYLINKNQNLQVKKKKITMANPSVEAIGYGEVEARGEPGASDEDWFRIFRFKLQATVPCSLLLLHFWISSFLYTLCLLSVRESTIAI